MIRIGVLVSGSGSNLASIIDACINGRINGEVSVVISNISDAYALQRAENNGIPTEIIRNDEYPDRLSFDMQIIKTLKKYNVDLVALAGFMRVLTREFLDAFPGRVMNIHPALLPSFPGLGVRRKAIDHGVRFSGCTVHFVDSGVDTGPIIIQAVVPVYPDDTEDELKDRILKLEHQIYPKAIQLYAQGDLEIVGRRVFIRGMTKDDSQCLVNPPLDK